MKLESLFGMYMVSCYFILMPAALFVMIPSVILVGYALGAVKVKNTVKLYKDILKGIDKQIKGWLSS